MIKNRYILCAIEEAKKSNYRFKIGCIIFDKDNMISRGRNYNKKSAKKLHFVYQKWKLSVHAEVDAILKARRDLHKTQLLVVRINAKDKLMMSKPCEECMRYICHVGIKGIYYSTNDGEIKYQRVRKDDHKMEEGYEETPKKYHRYIGVGDRLLNILNPLKTTRLYQVGWIDLQHKQCFRYFWRKRSAQKFMKALEFISVISVGKGMIFNEKIDIPTCETLNVEDFVNRGPFSTFIRTLGKIYIVVEAPPKGYMVTYKIRGRNFFYTKWFAKKFLVRYKEENGHLDKLGFNIFTGKPIVIE